MRAVDAENTWAKVFSFDVVYIKEDISPALYERLIYFGIFSSVFFKETLKILNICCSNGST